MDKLYYKEYYHLERSNWWFIVRSKILALLIKKHSAKGEPLKILNIGVATGATSEMLSHFGEVISVEFDEDCFEFTKTILKTEIRRGSILELEFEDASFDLVCAFDVIEHVEDDSLAISEMNRVCKNSGLLFVTVPTFMSLWGKHDEINHHFKRYSIKELKHLFEKLKSGSILYATYFNSLLFPFVFIVRKTMNILNPILPKRKGSGSDHNLVPDNTIVNSTLKIVFGLEIPLIKKQVTLPFGVSGMVLFRKGKNTF